MVTVRLKKARWCYLKRRLFMFFRQVMFALVCMMIGVLVMSMYYSRNMAEQARDKAFQLETDVNNCGDVVKDYIYDRAVIMRQFADMEARFTRMEHLMHIPRSERHGAWKEMEGN